MIIDSYNRGLASILHSIDIELITILREKSLFPKDKDEFIECLKVLDNDKNAMDKMLSHTNYIFVSLVDYYKTQSEDTIKLIIENI